MTDISTTQTSGLHDPSSHYFDPTLTYASGETTLIRQYFGLGSSDLAMRGVDQYEDSLADVGQFFVGDEPAATLATLEQIASVITPAESWEINRNPRSGQSVVDPLASAETLLARAILPTGGGLGSVTIDLAGDLPIGSYDPFFWDSALHEPVFLPVVSFVRIADDGILSRLRLGAPVAVVAYTPQSVIELREQVRADGTVRPARLAASLYRDRSGAGGPLWHGVIRTFMSEDDGEQALATLRSAVRTVASANRVTSEEDDPIRKVDEQPRSILRL